MNYPKRGELWLVDFDPSIGTEINKTRPALVISNDLANQKRTKITLVPLTTKIKKLPVNLIIEADNINNLTSASSINVPDICTFDKKRFNHKIGIITEKQIKEVENILKRHLGL